MPLPPASSIAGGGAALGVAPSKRFDTFVVGSCNQFAHAASEAVAGSPGSASYNPLFIYGGTGMGKTHLMHAIGNRVRRADPSARILYVTAEQFTNEMIDALRFRDMHGFREKYRHNVTLLLMDDVQFLSGKDRTQEELFHTFEWLRERGHQIVFTADVLPREIHGFAPRLRTRFESGMLADMQAPDAETVEAIVQRKAAERGLELGAEVARYLGGKLRGSIREVEGVLNRLLALSSMLGGRPDLDFVRNHLGRSLGETTAAPEPKAILKLVAGYYDVDPKDVLGKRRQRSLVLPRHVCMYLCRHHTERSFPELGRFFQRDHTTVQHGVKKIESRLAKGDLDLRRAVRHLEQSLG
jgi:chromosomal replication initiator protein